MSGDPPAFDQSDIDALFGDVGAPAVSRRDGIRALIETDVADHQRLPMLEVVCDRMLRSFATSMRQLTADPMEVSLAGVTGGRFGDLMNRAALPAMFGVFRIEPWGSHGVLAIEPALIYAAVDALLGGKPAGAPPRVDGRAFTSIETGLVGKLMEQVLTDFGIAFAQVAPISVRLERIETSPRFAFIAGPSIVTAHCQFRIDMEGRGGRFSLLLPSTTLEPVRDALTQRFVGERTANGDGGWAAEIEREVRRLPLQLQAVIGRRTLTLSELGRLGVGDHLRLEPEPGGQAVLMHDGAPLARALPGRRNGMAALRLNHGIGEEHRA